MENITSRQMTLFVNFWAFWTNRHVIRKRYNYWVELLTQVKMEPSHSLSLSNLKGSYVPQMHCIPQRLDFSIPTEIGVSLSTSLKKLFCTRLCKRKFLSTCLAPLWTGILGPTGTGPFHIGSFHSFCM